MTESELWARLPAAWRDEFRAAIVERVARGMSGATLLRIAHPALGDAYLKIAAVPHATELRGEIARTRWLAARGIHVPPLLRTFDDGRTAAAVMGALCGAHPEHAAQPVGEVIRALADALRALHAHAIDDCPFDETIASRLARAQHMIAQGLVTPEDFEERNRGLAPEAIYRRLIERRPAREDLVLVHGDATFDNMLIDEEGHVGFIDCGHAGRGDRYLDLAVVCADIAAHFGAEWIAPFARAYGCTIDPERLAFFGDLYELF